jgi:hypothetical protein
MGLGLNERFATDETTEGFYIVRNTPIRASVIIALVIVAAFVHVIIAEPPAPPKLSTVIPAAELVSQVKIYEKEFAAALVGEKEFAENAEKIKKDANTLVILALVLGQYDEPNEIKPLAPGLLKSAQALAKAKDYPAAKKAYEGVTAALASPSESTGELKWEKVASLGQLMEQVTLLNTKLNVAVRRLDPRRADESARQAAVLAAIGQAITYDTHEVKDPKDLDKWYQMCAEMRSLASELNAKIKAKDKDGATDVMKRITKNCDACHEVFHQE